MTNSFCQRENPSRECVSLTTSGVSRVLRGTCKIKELNEYKVNKNFKKKKSMVIFPGYISSYPRLNSLKLEQKIVNEIPAKAPAWS